MGAWDKLPAACAKAIQFRYDNKLMRFIRYVFWNYGWSGRQYGLQFHDQCFEPTPEIKEALRRLNLKEPWLFDQRVVRSSWACICGMNNERLARDQWTQWDDETFYLKPYLDEIEQEKLERGRSSGLKPGFGITLDQRFIRLSREHILAMKNERLPRDQWTFVSQSALRPSNVVVASRRNASTHGRTNRQFIPQNHWERSLVNRLIEIQEKLANKSVEFERQLADERVRVEGLRQCLADTNARLIEAHGRLEPRTALEFCERKVLPRYGIVVDRSRSQAWSQLWFLPQFFDARQIAAKAPKIAAAQSDKDQAQVFASIINDIRMDQNRQIHELKGTVAIPSSYSLDRRMCLMSVCSFIPVKYDEIYDGN